MKFTVSFKCVSINDIIIVATVDGSANIYNINITMTKKTANIIANPDKPWAEPIKNHRQNLQSACKKSERKLSKLSTAKLP